MLAYPTYQVSEDTVAATDAWLAGDGHPAPLRRLVAEGRDGVVRALKARAKDAESAEQLVRPGPAWVRARAGPGRYRDGRRWT